MKTPQTPLIVDNVRAWLSAYDSDVMQQAARTSRVAAVRGHVALMPDAHVGKGATIGSVIPTVEAIIPSAVGVDIGCGVVAGRVVRWVGKLSGPTTSDLGPNDLPDDLQPLITQWHKRIPAGLGKWFSMQQGKAWEDFVASNGLPTLWDTDDAVKKRAHAQMGTLGSGNHFVELCVGKNLRPPTVRGIPFDDEPSLWIMLHSGSRGPGNRLAQHHIEQAKGYMARIGEHLEDRELAYLVQGSDEFDAYIRDLMWAQAYAKWNRDTMLSAALEGLRDVLGGDLEFDTVINQHHNYAALEEHNGEKLWITRKGAIRAREGDLGVIPGSMGTGSYIVRGLGNPESYQSASHGAGRRMSRSKAKKHFTLDDIERQMEGVTWQSSQAKGLLDEIPGAYKNLEDVMKLQVDLVEPMFHLKTLVNYKGVESSRW